MNVRDSRVLVTGASRGIGEAIARRLAAEGARVAFVARNADLLAKVAADAGGVAVAADLAEPGQVEGLVARVEAEIGPLDILVNNAGVDEVGPLIDQTDASVRHIHEVNLISPIQLCRQALPGMLARGRGHIVNVSSLAGSAGFAGMTTYCSTKAGLTSFTGVLRLELKGTPIKTTLVSLGPIPTDMLEHVNEFEPTRLSFDRFYKLQLMVDIPKEQVADEVAAAIRSGRRHVRLPKRAVLFPMLTEAPRRLVELLLTGVRSS